MLKKIKRWLKKWLKKNVCPLINPKKGKQSNAV